MKRKAGELDESATWGAWSPISDSSASWNGSPARKIQGPVPASLRHTRNTNGNEHINFRTRKRIRDNRPDIDIIHHNTLVKLFNAQQQHYSSQLVEQDMAQQDETQHRPEPHTLTAVEPAQRNLHSFFNIPASAGHGKYTILSTQSCMPGLNNTCEDCGTPLQIDDTDMMDIDQARQFSSEEEYQCVGCRRSVCDMCAVRGDSRVCLECAMPGGG